MRKSVSSKNDLATSLSYPKAKILRILLEFEDILANSSKCSATANELTITLTSTDIIELFSLTNKADKAFGVNLNRILKKKNPLAEVNPSSLIKTTKRAMSTHEKTGLKKLKFSPSCKCTSGCVNLRCSCKKNNSICHASCSCSNCQNL